MSNLDVYFGSKKVVQGKYIELSDVQMQPLIKFKPEIGSFYTILMVDSDAPSSSKPINKHWLHMLIINNDETIVPFEPSNPPAGSGPHRYYICLFKQPAKLFNITQFPRPKFNVKNFVDKYHLELESYTMYLTQRN
jgi:phosphatidylethanolamine-binding protein (PEBP) family uncharacterized protein